MAIDSAEVIRLAGVPVVDDLATPVRLFRMISDELRRQALNIDVRVFGGYEPREFAETLDLSPATTTRASTVARVWLHRELGR